MTSERLYDDTGTFTVTNNTASWIDMLATTFEGDPGYTNSDSCGSQTVGPGGTCSFAITATPATCTTSSRKRQSSSPTPAATLLT